MTISKEKKERYTQNTIRITEREEQIGWKQFWKDNGQEFPKTDAQLFTDLRNSTNCKQDKYKGSLLKNEDKEKIFRLARGK